MAWQVLFLGIREQLEEFDGEDNTTEISIETDEELKKKNQYKKQVKKEPTLSAELEAEGVVSVTTSNIANIKIKFYLIDVEILFSRAPFLTQQTEEFSYVKPYLILDSATEQSNASTQQSLTKVKIPESLVAKNLVLEISGDGMQQVFKTYYPSKLKVVLVENYGELKVTTADLKNRPSVYCKVFYKEKGSGKSKFFRDGYTDIRGKFEYAQSSGSQIDKVEKFSILVLDDELGSVIKESNPPPKQESEVNETQVGLNMQRQNKILNSYQVSQNRMLTKNKKG